MFASTRFIARALTCGSKITRIARFAARTLPSIGVVVTIERRRPAEIIGMICNKVCLILQRWFDTKLFCLLLVLLCFGG